MRKRSPALIVHITDARFIRQYEGSAALVCVDNKPAVLYADGTLSSSFTLRSLSNEHLPLATPSCSSRESSTGGQLVGISGQVTISYTQGYSTSVTESTMLGSSLTANVGFKFFDLLDGKHLMLKHDDLLLISIQWERL